MSEEISNPALASLSITDIDKLLALLKEVRIDAEFNFTPFENYLAFHEKLSSLGTIFVFDWPRWSEGIAALQATGIPLPDRSLLDSSKYLTAIIRGDRFTEGIIQRFIKSGRFHEILLNIKGALSERPILKNPGK